MRTRSGRADASTTFDDPRAGGRPGDPRASLAVVPLQVLAGPEEASALAGAVAADVIRGLAGLSTWIAVIRTANAVLRTPVDLERLGQLTGARFILHGVVDAERGRLRISIELSVAQTGRVLWSQRFERSAAEPYELRQDAAPRIAGAVPPVILRHEMDRLALVDPEHVTAHEAGLQFYRMVMQPERRGFMAASALLTAAEQRPGPHDSVRLVRAWWHLMSVSQGWTADIEAAARSARAALVKMDRPDAAAEALLAWLHSVLSGDHVLAASMLDRVLEVTPSCGIAWSLKALVLCRMGDGKNAVFHAEQAETLPALGPEQAWRDHVIAMACYVAGRYRDAARWAKRAARHHPGLAANARILAASLSVQGRLEEARQAGETLLSIDPGFRIGVWRERFGLPRDQQEDFARRLRLAGLRE